VTVTVAAAVVCGVVMGIAGYLIGRRARSGAALPDGVSADPVAAYVRSLTEFGDRVIPVWASHVESSRQQMESAVGALVDKFAGIVALLDGVLSSSQSAVGDTQSQLFDTSRGRLGEVVATLNHAIEQRQQTLAGMRTMVELSDQMRVMTVQVSRVAAQTRLLALNAAIEAARVGEAGSGFQVVAGEVKELADLSGATGRQIEQMVDKISEAINLALSTAEATAVAETTTVHEANDKVQTVLDDLRGFVDGLQNSSDDLGRTATEIKDEIAQSLVHFQFQDRIGQRLGHVADGIESFPEVLRQANAGGAAQLEPIDYLGMLAELEKSYTMVEEHQLQGTGAPAAEPDTEIVFF
jgi:methyl-accepting chemotaxis protein